MSYEVQNAPKKLDLSHLNDAVKFAFHFLDIPFHEDQELMICFETMPLGNYGLCDYEVDEVILTISKRLSVKDIIRTLFHELVHVKQYATGNLQSAGFAQRWMGKEVTGEYENLPWEIEAFQLEEEMMKEFYGE
jgi:hypothetical protein